NVWAARTDKAARAVGGVRHSDRLVIPRLHVTAVLFVRDERAIEHPVNNHYDRHDNVVDAVMHEPSDCGVGNENRMRLEVFGHTHDNNAQAITPQVLIVKIYPTNGSVQ